MKTTATIYQLTNDVKTFEIYNEVTACEEVETSELAEAIGNRLFKVYSAQTRLKEVCNKSRFFGLSKTKPVFFELRVDGVIIFNSSELPNSYGLKCRIGDFTQDQFTFLIEELLNLFLD